MNGLVKLAPWEGSVVALRERMIFLLQDVSPHRGRYAYLQGVTGLSAARWQNLFLRRLYPSMDMVYAAMELKPSYSDWLIHGDLPHPLRGADQSRPELDRWMKFLEFQQRPKTNEEEEAELRADREAGEKP